MNRLTIAIPYTEDKQFETLALQLTAHPLVEEVLCLHQNAPPSKPPSLPGDVKAVSVDAFFSGPAINSLIEAWRTDYLLLILPGGRVELGARAPERLVQVADDSGAALVYSDFRERSEADGEVVDHPLIDYQRRHTRQLRFRLSGFALARSGREGSARSWRNLARHSMGRDV